MRVGDENPHGEIGTIGKILPIKYWDRDWWISNIKWSPIQALEGFDQVWYEDHKTDEKDIVGRVVWIRWTAEEREAHEKDVADRERRREKEEQLDALREQLGL